MRGRELGFTVEEIQHAVLFPEVSYAQPERGDGEEIRQIGDLAIGVNAKERVVKTVLLRRLDRWVHGRDRR